MRDRLLLVEDDEVLRNVLARSLARRGYDVRVAQFAEEALDLAARFGPQYAVVDLKLAGGASGLACVQYLHDEDPELVIVVLTGYASIATAVEAVKLGARHYLAKPANTDDIEAAFARADGDAEVELTERQTSIKTLEWERIHETLAETGLDPDAKEALIFAVLANETVHGVPNNVPGATGARWPTVLGKVTP